MAANVEEEDDHAGGHDSSERWLVSYADFITLLFALFVLLYAFSMQSTDHVNEAWEAMATAVGARPHRGGLRPELGEAAHGGHSPAELSAQQLSGLMLRLQDRLKHFAHSGITTRIDSRGLLISLPAVNFFASGDANIATSELPALAAVAEVLDGLSNPIEIDGFTDSVPISNSAFHDNWELSAARAASVLRFLLAHTHLAPDHLTLAGYGPYGNIADNATAEGRARNRRVEIVVRPLVAGATNTAGAR